MSDDLKHVPDRLEQFAVIMSHPKDTLKAPESFERSGLVLQMVAEKKVGIGEWRQSPVSTHLDINNEEYTIHGRRRGRQVELFRTHEQQETPHLREQYEQLGFRVGIKVFPESLIDEYLLTANRLLIHYVIIDMTKQPMARGLIAGCPQNGTLQAVYTSNHTILEVAKAFSIDNVAPHLQDGRLVALGTVLNNEVSLFAPEHVLRPYFRRLNGKPAQMGWIFAPDCEISVDTTRRMRTLGVMGTADQAMQVREERDAAEQVARARVAQAVAAYAEAAHAMAVAAKTPPAKKKRNTAAKKKRQEYQARQKAKKRTTKDFRDLFVEKDGTKNSVDRQISDQKDNDEEAVLHLAGGHIVSFQDVYGLGQKVLAENPSVDSAIQRSLAKPKQDE